MQQSRDSIKKSRSGLPDSGDAEFEFLPHIPLPKRLPNRPIAIADMANLFGVTHRTLHFYEEKKLLNPRRMGAMRVYSPREVQVMAFINLCREIGMPVAEIQELLQQFAEVPTQSECDRLFRTAMIERRKELMADESLLRRQMQQISEVLEHQDPDSTESNDNALKQLPFLSDSELACFKLMAEGYTPVRIAHTLDRDIDQIMSTEAGIIRKFGSTNRFQAIAKAVLLGLLED